MAFITPNFGLEPNEEAHLIGMGREVGSDPANREGQYIVAENLGVPSKTPIVEEEEMEFNRIVLAEVGDLKKMYLYNDGKIKIER